MDKYEAGRERLEQLIEWYKEHTENRNEATTRFHLIDVLLVEVLGWERGSITAEDSHEGEYTDYILHNSRALAILEAKREGDYFELPAGKKRLKYSLSGLSKDSENLKKALNQVSSYCQRRGVQIGIVSNGWQLIAFIANRTDGVPPLEGKGIVFDSLEAMSENYKMLWNVISKEGIHESILRRELLGDEIPNLPPKVSSFISKYPGFKNRNPFQTNMQILSDLVLEDVIREQEVEEDFLINCYSKSGALSQYATVSKEILDTRYKYLFEEDQNPLLIEKAVSKKGLSEDLREVISSSLSRRPIILVGDVGVGKSTFINNLVKVEAKDVFQNSIAIKIDLGSRAVLKRDLRDAFLDETERILDEEYGIDINQDEFVRGTYNLEFEKFKRGIYKKIFESNSPLAVEKEIEFFESKVKERVNHVKSCLEHISKARRQQIVIFIDNCDQRNDSTQQEAFLIAQEIAETWPVLTFVTLRPETFHRSIRSGALSGYHPKAFTISPPRIDDVIIKRLNFAQKITRGEIPVSKIQMTTNLGQLDSLIEVLKMSFRNNPDLFAFIDNISSGNIRIAIDYVKQFLGSGHVDTHKILEIYDNQGSYFIPLHEFIRAIIYGDNKYYDPSTSSIVNLFDVHYADPKEHFLLPILLNLLQKNAKGGKKEGFIPVKKIYAHLQSIGYTAVEVDNVLNFSFSKNLIESSQRGDIIETNEYPSMVRITTLGSYHIAVIISKFTYLDAVCVDIPIFIEEYQGAIRDTFAIDERLDRVEKLNAYLSSIWTEVKIPKEYLDWDLISANINADVDYIRERIN